MSVAKKAWKGGKSAKDKYDSAKGKYEVYERIEALVNQETRSGALLTEGVGLLLKLGGRVFGRSLSSHPFFSYYTKHLELVASALNAAGGYKRATETLRQASASAGNAQALGNLTERYRSKRNELTFEYNIFMGPSLEAAANDRDNVDQLDMLNLLDRWQDETAQLADEALALMMMVQAQLRAVESLLAAYERQVKGIAGLGGIGPIAARYASRERDFANVNGTFDIAMGNEAVAATGKALAMPLATAKQSFQKASREAKACAALATVAAHVTETKVPKELAFR